MLYIVLYLISPYINISLSKLDKDNFKLLLILAIAIFSIYAVFIDLYQEISNTEPMGMSPITAWGNKQGFNIVIFTLLYIIGAYLRVIEIKGKTNKYIKWLLLDICLIFLWAVANTFFIKT